MEIFQPKTSRYDTMTYKRCGQSGIMLPAISLGLWHNFGGVDTFENGRNIVRAAFDAGITHLDLANNYGPPPGSAEETFGRILDKDLRPFRDELFISTKAGYLMWPGPYGDWGSRKYLISSLDQSLKRMKLDYVDLFYHHRPDTKTPIEESMLALDQIVRSGKALYVGISNYSAEDTAKAAEILRSLGTPNIIHQAKYSMFERWVEAELLDTLEDKGMGLIAFSPLAQGLLTDRYLKGIPEDSRAAKSWGFLQSEAVNQKIEVVKQLNVLAQKRGQSLAQMAIAWLLKDKRVTSVLVGASSVSQLHDNLRALDCLAFSADELVEIEGLLAKA
jgi:L-glyceraldehyde 3-phosphate reductase